VTASPTETLAEARRYVLLAQQVAQLEAAIKAHWSQLSTLCFWHLSSTSKGGGVAEMMPNIQRLHQEVHLPMHWLVLRPSAALAPAFFKFTKALHNSIHNSGPGVDLPDLEAGRAAFAAVGQECAEHFLDCFFSKRDPALTNIVVLHDPQTVGLLPELKRRVPGVPLIWRCHIGSDISDAASSSAWAFLLPALSQMDAACFSSHEYMPGALSALPGGPLLDVIHPGISPLSCKNRELSFYESAQILMQGGLLRAPERTAAGAPRCGLVEEPYAHLARIYSSGDASFFSAPSAEAPSALSSCSACSSSSSSSSSSSAPLPPCSDPRLEGVPFLSRPVITQVSRWDSLKGWLPLLAGFVELKTSRASWAKKAHDGGAPPTPKQIASNESKLCRAVLCLAGPDPAGISDDPEGLAVLKQLTAAYDALPPEIRADVFICCLPLQNRDQNALLVNAIQRSSLLVVQNSLKEGFGLTCSVCALRGGRRVLQGLGCVSGEGGGELSHFSPLSLSPPPPPCRRPCSSEWLWWAPTRQWGSGLRSMTALTALSSLALQRTPSMWQRPSMPSSVTELTGRGWQSMASLAWSTTSSSTSRWRSGRPWCMRCCRGGGACWRRRSAWPWLLLQAPGAALPEG
jgi:trehalose synthase